jgi:hypothetical protein
MKSSEIAEFLVDNIELFSDEFFKHEDIFVFVNVVQTIDIGTKSSSHLPSVSCSQTLQTVSIRMSVFKFSNIN